MATQIATFITFYSRQRAETEALSQFLGSLQKLNRRPDLWDIAKTAGLEDTEADTCGYVESISPVSEKHGFYTIEVYEITRHFRMLAIWEEVIAKLFPKLKLSYTSLGEDGLSAYKYDRQRLFYPEYEYHMEFVCDDEELEDYFTSADLTRSQLIAYLQKLTGSSSEELATLKARARRLAEKSDGSFICEKYRTAKNENS